MALGLIYRDTVSQFTQEEFLPVRYIRILELLWTRIDALSSWITLAYIVYVIYRCFMRKIGPKETRGAFGFINSRTDMLKN